MPRATPTDTNAPAHFAPYERVTSRRRTPDPLVHCGRHFGRTVHTFWKVEDLLRNGVLYLKELTTNQAEEDVEASVEPDQRIFRALLDMVPDLRDGLICAPDVELLEMAKYIQKGVGDARADDTKAIKGAIIGWMTPDGSQALPELSSMSSRGFRHEWTGALLCPSCRDWTDNSTRDALRHADQLNHPLSLEDQEAWPMFLYAEGEYDATNAWQGLFKNTLLIKGFRHVFFSPSSANKGIGQSRSTRAGQAQIHGMKEVTPASIAYVATQIKFSLSSAKFFTPSLMRLEYKPFYERILNVLTSVEEKDKVDALLAWWNLRMFPPRAAFEGSALHAIREARRRRLKAAAELSDCSGPSTETSKRSYSTEPTSPEA